MLARSHAQCPTCVKTVRGPRDVGPLALYFWGPVWTLAAWCELRNDFRNFRVDRIANAMIAGRSFADEPGKTLADFISRVVKD